MITTVAGNGQPGFSGDNGPATNAELDNPFRIALDAAGSLYIADSYNARVRKVSEERRQGIRFRWSYRRHSKPASQ